MGARFVPITIQIGGAQQGAAEVRVLTNSFNQLDNTTQKTAAGGLRNSFNATQLIRTELQALGSQIPIVGRFFNGLSSDVLRFASQAQQVSRQVSAQKTAFNEFIKFFERVTRGHAPGETTEIIPGFTAAREDLRNAPKLFGDYVKAIQSIEDPTLRAHFVIGQFGAKGQQLIPVLEGMTEAEAAAAGQTAAVGASFAAIAGPVAIALAAIVAIVAAFGLAVKAGWDLTNMAVAQASKLQDLSDRTNFNVETLQALEVGALKSGTSLEKLSTGLGIFDKNITQAYESDTKLAKQFKDFNIDLGDNERALRQVLTALQAMPPGAKQTELAMLAFGQSGKDVLGVLKNLDGSIDEQIERLKQMGFVISTQDVKAAADFGRKIDILGLKLTMMGVRIGLELLPYFDRMVSKLDELANRAGPQVKQWADNMIESIKNVNAVIQAGLFGYTPGGGDTGTTITEALWFGRAASWLSGAGLIIEALRQVYNLMDKIGSKIRGPQPKSNQPYIPAGPSQAEIEEMMRHALDRPDLKNLPAAQREQVDQLLSKSKQRSEEAAAAVQNFGDKTREAALREQIMRDKTLELPPVLEKYRSAIEAQRNAYNAVALAEARRLDQLEAAKKAYEEQNKILDQNQQQLAALKTEVDNYGVSTHRMAVEKQIAAQNTENLTEAQKRLNDVINKDKLANADILDARRLADEEAKKAADINAWLTEQIALQKEAQAQLTGATLDGITASEAFRKAEILKGAALAYGNQELLKSAEAEAAKTTALQEQAKAAEAFARSPLGRATEENARLLEEERGLRDPILMQMRMENELLRDEIDFKLRDFDATLSLAHSMRELGDATKYHANQADASVAAFLAQQKTITEIVADAKIGVIQTAFDYIDRALDRWTHKLGLVGDLIKQIIGDFIRLALVPAFARMFGINVGQSSVASGQSNGGILGNIFGGIFNRGAAGSTGVYGTPPFAGNFAGSAGTLPAFLGLSGGITIPPSLSGAAANNASVSTAIHEAIHGGSSSGGAAAAAANPAFYGNLALTLPFLGAAAGASLGGPSRLGQGLGIAGGALLGLVGIAAAPTSIGGLGAGLFGLNALGFAALGIGAAAVIAAIIIGKNAQRRNAEKQREQLSLDTIGQLNALLAQAKSGDLTMAQATAAFEQIRVQYFNSVSQIKDSKTRRIATDWWYKPEHPPQVIWKQIQAAVTSSQAAKLYSAQFVPTFAGGGLVPWMGRALQPIRVTPGEGMQLPGSALTQIVPGQYRGIADTVLTAAPVGTRIIPRSQMPNVRGYAGGGLVGGDGGELRPIVIYETTQIDAAGMVKKVLKSADGRKITVQTIRQNINDQPQEILGDVKQGLASRR